MPLKINTDQVQYVDIVRAAGYSISGNAATRKCWNPKHQASGRLWLRWIIGGQYFDRVLPDNNWHPYAEPLELKESEVTGRIARADSSYIWMHEYTKADGGLLVDNKLCVAGIWITIPDRKYDILLNDNEIKL